MLNFEPNTFSEIPKVLAEYAQKSGQKLMHLSLTNKPSKEQVMKEGMKAIEGKALWVAVDFVPRVGEFIRTDNKTLCEVNFVGHAIFPMDVGGTRIFSLFPFVHALLDEKNSGV